VTVNARLHWATIPAWASERALPAGVQDLYDPVDTGFANLGKASGDYAAVDGQNAAVLPDLPRALTEAVTQTDICGSVGSGREILGAGSDVDR